MTLPWCVSGTRLSAQLAPSDVDAVVEAVLDEFDVFHVIFDDANQVAKTILLLFQVLLETTGVGA